jgi:phosphoribosylformimino-5-aminoimidazole carboxamide ribotide isomerase
MRVIPVLDLRHGQAVHARAGDRRRYSPVSTVLASGVPGDALALARGYRERLGLAELYVADLDAITGASPQQALVSALARETTTLWLDAGIASPAHARAARHAGAARVIVGLETLPARAALAEIVDAAGAERVAFSLDLRSGVPVAAPELAWLSPVAIAELAARSGVQTIIALDLARVGTGTGVDLALVRQLRAALPSRELIVGGGVSGPVDLARLTDAGADGALVGSALHDGRIDRGALAALTSRRHPAASSRPS